MFTVMMAVTGAKEPLIAVGAAIRVLKKHMVKKPIFEATSLRSEELFAAAIGTTGDLGLGSGSVHRKILCRDAHVTTARGRTGSPAVQHYAVCSLSRNLALGPWDKPR